MNANPLTTLINTLDGRSQLELESIDRQRNHDKRQNHLHSMQPGEQRVKDVDGSRQGLSANIEYILPPAMGLSTYPLTLTLLRAVTDLVRSSTLDGFLSILTVIPRPRVIPVWACRLHRHIQQRSDCCQQWNLNSRPLVMWNSDLTLPLPKTPF